VSAVSSPVRVITVPARPTVVVAETTTWEQYPSLWGKLLGEVYAFVRACPDFEAGESQEPRWQNVMLYKDQRPSVEVGVLASGPFTPQGRVIASQLPGGRVATAVHRGDYARLGDTHGAVHAYIEAHDLEPAGPLWEIYGHMREDPEDVETEIYHLLR
jgi:effector-binding domain-containing protein